MDPTIVKLVELIELDGRSQSAIAAEAGMSRAQLSQVVTGHRAAPSIITVRRILEAVGRRFADLDD